MDAPKETGETIFYIVDRLLYGICWRFVFQGDDNMTNAMLNTILYQKRFAKQEVFKAELILLLPEEVLVKAYKYVYREELLVVLEYNDISSRQTLALLKFPTPLADVFKKLDGWEESRQMENIWNAIKARANEMVRTYFIESRRDAR